MSKREQVEKLRSCAVHVDRDGNRKGRSRNYHWWIKRWLNRAERRVAKVDPENAPIKRQYKGYEG